MQDGHNRVCLRIRLTRQIVLQVRAWVSYQNLGQLKVNKLQGEAHLLMRMQMVQGGSSSKSRDIQATIPMTQA